MTRGFYTDAVFQAGSTETLPLAVDISARLGSGETPTSPASELRDITTGTMYPAGLSGSASVNGSNILQSVTALQKGHRYLLVVSFTAGGRRESVPLELQTVF
jgi:hypothetical protein